MEMRYAGQTFPLYVGQRLSELMDWASAEQATWRKITFANQGGSGLFLFGGGIPVAFTVDNPGEPLPEV